MSLDHPQELLKPVSLRFVWLTLAIALLLELVPLPVGRARFMPDFVGLLVLYWAINQPRLVGVGTAFTAGLIADIATAGLFGQHALAYSATCYLAQYRQRQLVMLGLGQQSLVVLGLMLCNQAIMVLARMATGAAFVGFAYFLPPIIGALLWPLLTKLMLLPYRRG
ncbi:rod shape-determining protein MreD [Crenobacter caeni]|uniref:Rod shape-determining protein MreD n=1 Tax=Crenobacter caeni TaxID=2705474 RepID=A0A6B2KMF4_9NEIS|nr:rod shape-determining protein MreD [Crenobacter caeni]NDV11298.1 rod shape-determining protein MreD [Crenobacter caeni]